MERDYEKELQEARNDLEKARKQSRQSNYVSVAALVLSNVRELKQEGS